MYLARDAARRGDANVRSPLDHDRHPVPGGRFPAAKACASRFVVTSDVVC